MIIEIVDDTAFVGPSPWANQADKIGCLVAAVTQGYLRIMAHSHHPHRGDALQAAARDALEQAGEQWTPMRATVYDALSSFEKPASAYDIADAVGRRQDRRVAANSVYRILDLFVAKNLAQRVETANAYIVNDHPACRHDCIFLVCDQCGQTTHIDDDSLAERVRGSARAVGFEPVRPVIEVKGRCADCAAA